MHPLFSLITLLSLLPSFATFKLHFGLIDLIPASMSFPDQSQNIINNKLVARIIGFVYPYQIFEYYPNKSLVYNRHYIMRKLNYQDVIEYYRHQNRALNEIDEFYYLYAKLPQFIKIQPAEYEYIELICINQPIHRKHIIIKNSSIDQYFKGKPKNYHLHFYTLHIHKYFFLEVSAIKRHQFVNTSSNETTHKQWKISELHQISKQLKNNTNANKLKLLQTLDNLMNLKRQPTYIQNVLLQLQLTRQIKQNTKWTIRYNRTALNFFSFNQLDCASPVQRQAPASIPAKHITALATAQFYDTPTSITKCSNLQLVTISQGHVLQGFRIQQFSHSFQIEQILHMDVCVIQERTHIMIGDGSKLYIIDVSQRQWHLAFYKQLNKNSHVFLTSNCNLLQTQTNSTTLQLRKFIIKDHLFTSVGITCKMNLKEPLASIQALGYYYFVVCYVGVCQIVDQECRVLVGNVLVQVDVDIKWVYREVYLNGSIKSYAQAYDIQSRQIISLQINSAPIMLTSTGITNKTISTLWRSIYNIQSYQEQVSFRNLQMNELIWERIAGLPAFDVPLQVLQYQQFSEQLSIGQGKGCCAQIQGSYIKSIVLNQSQQWSFCSVSFNLDSSSLINLQLQSKQSTYEIFMCAIAYKYMDDYTQQTACGRLTRSKEQVLSATLGQTTEYNAFLANSHFYKFYFIRTILHPSTPTQPHTLTLTIKNLQKQQLQYATSIFYFIIINLSIILFICICIGLLRPVLVLWLVYFGVIRQQGEDTYPLSYMGLKIRLKRFRNMGFIRYGKKGKGETHQLTDNDRSTDDQLLCCFCLQQIKIGDQIAQLYCHHQFHAECFNEWMKNEPNTKCPSCRRQFTKKGLQSFNKFRAELQLVNDSVT